MLRAPPVTILAGLRIPVPEWLIVQANVPGCSHIRFWRDDAEDHVRFCAFPAPARELLTYEWRSGNLVAWMERSRAQELKAG
jgi:hypothetical protein